MPARKKKSSSKAVANLQQQIAEQAAKVTDAIGAAVGSRIRITNAKNFVAPDGSQTPGPLEMVVVDFTTQHMMYEGAFDPDNPTPPACFAIGEPASLGGRVDELRPSANASDPQSDTCAVCPQNQFGSDSRMRGKRCKNTRVLALLSPTLEDEDNPMLLLTVSPSALKSFDGYVRTLASKQQIPVSVVTEISFDENLDYPSLRFRPVDMNPQLEVHWGRMGEAQELLKAEPDLSSATEKSATKKKVAKKKTSRRRVA